MSINNQKKLSIDEQKKLCMKVLSILYDIPEELRVLLVKEDESLRFKSLKGPRTLKT